MTGFFSPRRLLWICCLFSSLLSTALLGQTTDASGQEYYLTFNYSSGLVNTVVTALHTEQGEYLPVMELFRLFKVKCRIDSTGTRVSGFYVTESRPYYIDAHRLSAKVDTVSFALHPGNILQSGLDIYLTPGLWQRLFGLRFNIDMQQLTLALETEEELPIVLDHERERRERRLNNLSEPLEQPPLLYPRRREMLDGGFLDYSLMAVGTKSYRAYGYDTRIGGILAGGDLELATTGSFSTHASSTFTEEGRWRYAIDDSPYISTVMTGDLFAGSIRGQMYKGVQVTNEPLQPRILFQSYQIQENALPDWTVELYVNERLAGVAKADAMGTCRFTIPLTYGTTYYTIRRYGPNGEISEEQKRVQIPFTFLPPGEVNYVVDAGVARGSNDRLIHSSVAWGATSWLTLKTGMEYVGDSLSRLAVYTIGASSWLMENYIVSLEAASRVSYRADIGAVYASQASVSASLISYEKNSFYNPSSITTEIQSMASLPMTLAALPVNFRLQASRQNFSQGATTMGVIGGTMWYRVLNASLEYRYSEIRRDLSGTIREPVIAGAMMYSIPAHGMLARLTPNILFGSSANYNTERKGLSDFRLDVSSNITPQGRIQCTFSRDIFRNQNSASLQFIYEFDVTRSTTSMTYANGEWNATQNVRGSIGYDSRRRQVIPYTLESVGHGAMTLRGFVDKNGNGVYDADESPVGDLGVGMGQAAMLDFNDPGIVHAWQLLPYTRYAVNLVEISATNPLLVPVATSFSVMTEPDVYKPIDIPFMMTGVLDGSVLMRSGDRSAPTPGLDIHVASSDGRIQKSVRVFSDGTFYLMGIPPGSYVAWVDSMQMQILKAVSEPPLREFTIHATGDGDYVSGMEFLLKRTAVVAPSTKTDDTTQKPDIIFALPKASADMYQIVASAKPKGFKVVLSTWTDQKSANLEAHRIALAQNIAPRVEQLKTGGKTNYQVYLGIYPSREEALRVLRKLRSEE